MANECHRSVSRRKVLSGTTSIVIASGLAGCNTGSEGDGDQSNGNNGNQTTKSQGKSIELLTHLDASGEKAVLEEYKKSFEEDTGHTLELTYTGAGDIPSTVGRRVRANNAPEASFTSFPILATFLGEDVFQPLGDIRSELESQYGEVPDNLWLNETSGEVVGAPFMQNAHNLSVRKDLVNQVGHSFPDTVDEWTQVGWDQNLEWARAINEQTNVGGWALPYGNSTKSVNDLMAVLWSHGVEIWQGETGNIKVTLDESPFKKKAVTATMNAIDAIETGPDAAGWEWGDVSSAFGSGKISEACYSIGRMLQATRENNEEHWNDVVPITPPFVDSRSDGTRMTGAVNGISLFKGSENPDAARELVNHFYNSDIPIKVTLAAPFHYWPSFPEMANSDVYTENEKIKSRPKIREFQKKASPYLALRTQTAQGGFNPHASTAYAEGMLGKMVARVKQQGMDPEEAIDRTAEELRSIQE